MENQVFDNTLISSFLTCPRLCYYQNVLNIAPKDLNIKMMFGSAIHDALATFASASGDAGLRENKAGMAFLSSLPREQFQDPVYGRHNGLTLLEWLLDQSILGELVEIKDVAQVEIGFALDIGGGYLYGGKIDQVIKHPQYTGVVIVDHKTTSRVTQNFMTVLALSRQFTGYILAAAMNMAEGSHVALAHIVSVKPIRPTIENPTGFRRAIIPITKTEDELNSFIRETRKFIEQFLECYEKDFWPRSAQCGGYGAVCPYLHLCISNHATHPFLESIGNEFVQKEKWAPWEELENKWI